LNKSVTKFLYRDLILFQTKIKKFWCVGMAFVDFYTIKRKLEIAIDFEEFEAMALVGVGFTPGRTIIILKR
jgi:hypothetical protein